MGQRVSFNSVKLWHNQNSMVMDKQQIVRLKELVSDSISKIYYEMEFNNITESSKLRTFAKFKFKMGMEKYVCISDVPLSWRRQYCSFRISCHDLEIERGRYIRPRKPPEERICKLCNIEPETESHFLITCNTYANLRGNLYKNIIHMDPMFEVITDSHKFIYLMTSKNIDIIKMVMQFIHCAMEVRKKTMK